MKPFLMILFTILLQGCSHTVLMKCSDPAPTNVYHCPDDVQDDYRFCTGAKDDFQCEPIN